MEQNILETAHYLMDTLIMHYHVSMFLLRFCLILSALASWSELSAWPNGLTSAPV